VTCDRALFPCAVSRESIEAHMKLSPIILDGEEMSVFRKMWCQLSLSRKWCMRTFVNFVYKWIQLHVFFDIDDEVQRPHV